MKDFPFWIFLAFFTVFAGRMLYGRLKYGSWTGSFLKGSIERTNGEIVLAQGVGTSQTLKVHTMRDADSSEAFVGLVLTARAPLGGSMQCFKLTKTQASELANMLGLAIR